MQQKLMHWYLVVFPTTTIPLRNISVKCNEVSTTIQDSVIYLGQTRDNKLKFKQHLNAICVNFFVLLV